jgi:hypothetical protein
MPSWKESGVELAVGCAEAGGLADDAGVAVGTTVGVTVGVAAGVALGSDVAVDAGVAVGVGDGTDGTDGCRWHWQSKRTVALRMAALTHGREAGRAT